ncbi:MerR family transcriptional regulator [Pseudoteredinibacter isoporae]|uniref:DNA-binding transcriptional MerR regulator n=1 Tax=Pseudoteredinibacter isoporae TaxID=570281 RepID=A0A7X0JUW8_9GAMM|nr:MerR family transcriptional regulator [Pseudoteredinibacter isoporae]MBB6521875.1 DNA-binding transcriptional MerR regulator [Pseudoteredinibacter isoporae]NHO87419.1 MerR family transcriptional regulator [Pseudoteredinibacter isoporae]NIB24250.1 MerR family transcriptional regulator [Pseudoteredinibacter isoporae]
MYSIGEFSKITQMTVKTLRFYHKKGIIEPSYINPDSGYRYYGERDLEVARLVKALKSLDFSLEEIQKILSEVDSDAQLVQALTEKKSDIDRKIKGLRKLTSSIDLIIHKELEVSKMNERASEITMTTLDDCLVLATRWKGPYSDTGKAMSVLYKTAGRHGRGPAFNLYYDGEHKKVAEVESCLPLKKEIKSALDCRVLKGGKCVSLIHSGPYDTLGESYKKLFDYLSEHQLHPSLPTREVYLKGPGMIFKGNPDRYRTEIHIPIE